MDFRFSDEQQQLRHALRGFLGKHYGFAQRKLGTGSESGWQPQIWQGFAHELGLLGICLPERLGGTEQRAVETMVIMEELGNALVVEPFLETIVVAGGLLRLATGELADRALESIASGAAIYAVGLAEPTVRDRFADTALTARREGAGWRLEGCKSVVTAAPWATHLLVLARTAGHPGERHGLSLFQLAADTPGLRTVPYQTLDSRRAADLRFENVALPASAQIGVPDEAIVMAEQVADEGIAALSAEALGILRRMLQDTLNYTKQRRQFGRPLAELQVLQHRMVDMFMAIENATSAVYLATLELASEPRQRSQAAAAAKVAIGAASRLVGQYAIQMHGGIGMADELALGHYFKRATVIESEFGTADDHIARYTEMRRDESHVR